MAIHWRTSAVNPNVAALGRASWDYSDKEPTRYGLLLGGVGPGVVRAGRRAEAAKALQAFDGKSVDISNLVHAGRRSTDEEIEAVLRPEAIGKRAVCGQRARQPAWYHFWLDLCWAQYHRTYAFTRAIV